jgi:hypothetical protein
MSKPELTNEQKLSIVLAQREYIKTDSDNQIAEKNLQITQQNKRIALQNLSDAVDRVGIELGLEKGKYTVNLDQLALIETAPAKE